MTRTTIQRIAGIMGIISTAACGNAGTPQKPGVTQAPFGTADGKPITAYTLRNAKGMEVRAINYGGVILSIQVPDRQGKFADVVLGFDSVAPYETNPPYFGAIIGRYGNRIAKGQFTLGGRTYQLPQNDKTNTLHGGKKGFDKMVWEAQPFDSGKVRGIVFRHTSPDGDQGFPGTLQTTVTYTLTDDDQLIFDYAATTDKATPVNLIQHSYFNLAGDGSGNILGHEVYINADRFTPVDSLLIPTGELRGVAGTPFDFRTPTAIGARINVADPQLKFPGGYDMNFVLNKPAGTPATEPTLAARVYEPKTGRVLEIRTTEPGMQFYSGNFLDGTLHGKKGVVYQQHYGFAMETQHFPDSPNKPQFPSTILQPGQEYHSRSIYTFSVRS